MAQYQKPALAIEDQIAYLRKKQLIMPDESKPANYLANINYYRLKAYMIPFYNPAPTTIPKQFKKGVEFNDVLDLYIFDRKLRLLVFDAIEKIEIALRAQIICHLSQENDAWWYKDGRLFKDGKRYQDDTKQLEGELNRSGEEFIKHYKNSYHQPAEPPAWMAIEVLSFGLLSKIFHNLKSSKAKKAIADHFNLPNAEVLASWMKSLNFIRNICAHHGRLWNRVMIYKPQLLKRPKAVWLIDKTISINRLYVCLSTIIYLLKVVTPTSHFAGEFKKLHQLFPKVDLRRMGFPPGWENEPLWQ